VCTKVQQSDLVTIDLRDVQVVRRPATIRTDDVPGLWSQNAGCGCLAKPDRVNHEPLTPGTGGTDNNRVLVNGLDDKGHVGTERGPEGHTGLADQGHDVSGGEEGRIVRDIPGDRVSGQITRPVEIRGKDPDATLDRGGSRQCIDHVPRSKRPVVRESPGRVGRDEDVRRTRDVEKCAQRMLAD
jgi:hypothetical protein